MEHEYDNWRPLHNVISRVLPPPPPVCVDETGGGGGWILYSSNYDEWSHCWLWIQSFGGPQWFCAVLEYWPMACFAQLGRSYRCTEGSCWSEEHRNSKIWTSGALKVLRWSPNLNCHQMKSSGQALDKLTFASGPVFIPNICGTDPSCLSCEITHFSDH